MATSLAGLLISTRAMVGDGPTDNYVRLENLNNPDNGNNINGKQLIFNVANYPMAPGGLQQVISDSVLLTSGYTSDEPFGQINLTVAPTQTLTASYYYFYFADAIWTEFITNALEQLNQSVNGPAVDIPLVPEGLLQALKSYTAYNFAMRMASQTATWYNQRLQERDEARDSISVKWLKIAAQYKKDADAFRNDFYSGGGTQLKPAFQIVEMDPRHYTPSR